MEAFLLFCDGISVDEKALLDLFLCSFVFFAITFDIYI